MNCGKELMMHKPRQHADFFCDKDCEAEHRIKRNRVIKQMLADHRAKVAAQKS